MPIRLTRITDDVVVDLHRITGVMTRQRQPSGAWVVYLLIQGGGSAVLETFTDQRDASARELAHDYADQLASTVQRILYDDIRGVHTTVTDIRNHYRYPGP